jgi:Zn-dependent protease with chaperone function
MSQEPPTAPPFVARPQRYHREVRDYLGAHEPELWKWFSSAQAREEHLEARRVELLKTTVRLDADSHPDLHAALNEVAGKLGLSVPLRVYQAQHAPEVNAMLAYLPGEVHIVFSGSLLSLLGPAELRAVLAHELAHYLFWQMEDGALLTAARVLDATAAHPHSANCHQQTARRWSLHTEVFADRIAFEVTRDLEACVAALVKSETGLTHVSGRGYLQQAEEILSKGDVFSQQLTHPELFIRARARALWQEQGALAEPRIAALLEHSDSLDDLDVLAQEKLTALTRRFLGLLLRPRWFRSDAVLAHAKLFFEDFRPADADDPTLASDMKGLPPGVREYFAWLLADFAMADRDLEDLPLAAALHWSERLDLEDAFQKLAGKELKLKVRDLKKLKSTAAETLARAEVSG